MRKVIAILFLLVSLLGLGLLSASSALADPWPPT